MINRDPEIVIAATCFADANSAIEIGKAIQAPGAHFRAALLIEQSAGAKYAATPEERRSQPDISASAIRHDAMLFRSHLETGIGQLDTTVEFEQVECDLDTFFLGQSTSSGFLCIGFKPLHQLADSVVVLVRERTFVSTLQDVANQIAAKRRLVIVNLQLHQAEGTFGTVEDTQHIVTLTKAEILSKLGRMSVRTLITDYDTVRELGLRKLLFAARCPILIRLETT